MEGDGDAKKVLPDLNKCEDEENERFWEKDQGRWPRINDAIAHIHDREDAAHWKSLLNMTSMHVLVVEKDEATSYTVAVLLRRCGYEVTVASNGLEAWKVLTDHSNHIDLVLCEIDIPGLSGIALLCKIIGHNTLKHIPVVIMSLNDSTGLVFNCLSNGAVDFLMKPLRRIELKNLWQHVWRRYHCPYVSWSEVGKQVQKSVKSKGDEDFDGANTCSSEEDDGWSFALSAGCDYGSDSQDNGSILRHLGLSSFSRYNASSNYNESHCGNMGSDFPCDKTSEVVKDSLVNFLSPLNARSPNPCSEEVADSFSCG